MVKKLLLCIPIFTLFLLVFSLNTNVLATSNDSVSNEESNGAQTQYGPEKSNDEEISPLKFKIENGFIACMPYGGRTDCNWNIKVTGDYFVYNGVTIDIQKNHGWLNGGWKAYDSYSYNYKISESANISTLRNTKTFDLPKGEYRARLGGTFILLTNGTFVPIGYDWANFEVN
ncbi:hypothetical protein [Psychrobacillus sp. FSL K6-1267]|uniref:hypothetical protein n=1 Tax=Psychrobacillus sp. FSL K6-1267 TaxID=2921543 RepID=UPI0030F8538C